MGMGGALFFGRRAAGLAVVREAVVRVGRRALKSRAMVTVAALAFIGIFFFAVPFPVIVAAAALIGFAGNAAHLEWFKASGGHGPAAKSVEGPAAIDEAFAQEIPAHVRPSLSRLIKVPVIGGRSWCAPLF